MLFRSGVIRREAIDQHGEGEDGEVEWDEEAQRCDNDHGASRSGGKKGDERRREEEERSLGGNGVRLIAAEDLVSDLEKTTGSVSLVAVAAEFQKDWDSLMQTRRSGRRPPPWGTNL